MRLKLLATATALAISLVPPAAARNDASAEINAAYERGKAWDEPATTLNEFVECAAFWHVWREFHEEDFGATTLSKLDPALRNPGAEAAQQHWEMKANEAAAGIDGGEAQFKAAADHFIKQAWAEGEALVFGDRYLYAEMLGMCALPAED